MSLDADDRSTCSSSCRTWAEAAANRPDAKVKALDRLARREHPPRTASGRRAGHHLHRVPGDAELAAPSTSPPRGSPSGAGSNSCTAAWTSRSGRRIKAAFQADPSEEGAEVRILLATDAACEGIDLQNHCSKLIHFEIPWNPNGMEQRNGRIDRHGQQADEVDIFHFVPGATTTTTPDPDGRSGRPGR